MSLNSDTPIKNRWKDYSLIIMLILIVGIVIAEIISIVIVHPLTGIPGAVQILLEITLLIIVIIPLLYFFSIRPLRSQIALRQRSENIIKARLRLLEYAGNHTQDELMEYTINEVEKHTASTVGFFHFLDTDQKTIKLQAWSTNTRNNICKVEGRGYHSDLDKAGVWADAVRLRKPVVHNNLAELSDRKGLPDGHADIQREMVIPILRDNLVVAIIGVGNKPCNYTSDDIEASSIIADFTWDIIDHLRSDRAIHASEERFRTLVDWTYDWELWLDPRRNIVYSSPSCERITGYTPEEFTADPALFMRIVHPDDYERIEEHQKVVHDTSSEPISLEYRIIDRNGSVHWIEHICRPLFNSHDQHLGRRISNRDITERKAAEQRINEQNQKELELMQTIRTLQADIGRDLHDTLGNQISFLRMNLEYLSEAKWSDGSEIKLQIQKMTAAANESYEMIRAMLAILQVDDVNDPISLFSRYAEQIADRASFNYQMVVQGVPRQLSLYQIRQLFYIFREALGNIEKYAKPEKVTCVFNWSDDSLQLVIRDDGVGFDPETLQKPGHYGIKFMRERAEQMRGFFSIQTKIGEGTSFVVEIPFESKPVR